MKRLAAAFLTFAILVTPPASAQDAMPGEFAQVYQVTPLQGQVGDFENHMKAYINWAVGQGASWSWVAFEVVMGERSGQYMFGTFNHEMADWDTPDIDQEADRAATMQHIMPYAQGYQGQFMRNRRELGTSSADAPLRPFYQVIRFQLNNGQDETFIQALTMLKGALDSAGMSGEFEYSVFQSIIGGSGGEWAISIPHETFASMAPGEDDAMEQLIASVYGEFHADTLTEMFNEAVASVNSELFVLRPDLSINLPPM